MNTPTQATHTAGPWFAGDGTNSSEEGTIYCDSEMRSAVGFACGSSRARKIANARLFAAAPELLAEAMQLLRNATYADGQATALTQDCEALESAIARATGGAPTGDNV